MSDETVTPEAEPVAPDAEAAPVDERSPAEIERDEYLDTLRRLQADFENYRKRVARDADEAAARASGRIVESLLPVLDAFDYAQAHFEAADSHEAVALTQARSLLLDSLAREGLERIDAPGVEFDPTVHDAVAHDAGDAGGGPVVEDVLRAGYRWKGNVLRPAMVRVRG